MNLMSPTTKEANATKQWIMPLSLVLLSYPTWLVLTTSPILVVAPIAICAYWLLIRRKLYFLAGLMTALCIFKIEWMPFLLLPGLILGRLRFAGGAALAAIGAYGAAQLMHQPLEIATLLNAGQSTVPAHALQNFSAMLVLILGENSANLQIGTMAIYIVAIVCSTELWWRLHQMQDSQNKFLKKCAATTLIMLTTSAHTNIQDYIAIVPIILWLWQATADEVKDSGGLIRRVIVVYPFLTWIFFAAQTAFPALTLPVYFVWAVVLSVTVLPTLDVEVNNILNRRFKAPQT